MKNKSFIYQSYRINGSPDERVKDHIRAACKKFCVNLLTEETTGNDGESNRPDLMDPALNFVVESDGLWHKTKKGISLTKRRIKNYRKLGISCAIFDPSLFNYLCANTTSPYEWYLAPIIQTYNINNEWGIEL